MKRNLLLISSIFISFSLCSQSITEEGNEWRIGYFNWMQGWVTTPYKIIGDSIHNGTLYKKVYRNFENPQAIGLAFLMREDSTQRVFINENNQERIVYDFQAEVGDTISDLAGSSFPHSVIVESIDSVMLLDGSFRKMQKINSLDCLGFSEEFWIEGIGGRHFAFLDLSTLCAVDVSAALNCFSANGQQLIGPLLGDECDILLSIEDLQNSNFSIFPNPTENHIFIKNKNTDPSKINLQLIDYQGVIVFEKMTTIYPNQSLPLPVYNISSGVYFLKIEDLMSKHNNTLTIQKIIISR